MARKKLSQEQKMLLLSRLLPTREGRAKLAASLTMPLRTERDYYSIARKLALAEDLPVGVFPIYDKDVDVSAYFIADTGVDIVSVVRATNVAFPLFDIAANPSVPIHEIQERRYDVVMRMKDKGRSEINRKEDLRFFSLVNKAATDTTNPNTPIAVSGSLTSDDLADAFGLIGQHDLVVASVVINPRDYVDFLKFTRDTYDPETQRDVLRTGRLGTLWGAGVYQSSMVPVGTVYVLAEPEFVGRIPVRSDLVVLPADDATNRRIGFSMFERLGMGIHNIKAVASITITR